MHNCVMRIKEHFDQVNDLISAVKASTVKMTSNADFFSEKILALSPEPEITRWGSWLDACTYYCKNLDHVKEIILSYSG